MGWPELRFPGMSDISAAGPYREEEEAAFELWSRRPLASPNAMSRDAELMVRLRKELPGQGLDAGPLRWPGVPKRSVRRCGPSIILSVVTYRCGPSPGAPYEARSTRWPGRSVVRPRR